jgi:hypothetical protein
VTNIHAFGDTYGAYNFQADGFSNKRNFISSFYSEKLLHTTGRTFTPDHWEARKEKYGEMLRGKAYSYTVEGMEGDAL